MEAQELNSIRTASVITMIVGVWLVISPLFISITGGALVNQLVIGAIFFVLGVAQMVSRNTVASWLTGIAAIWIIASAFVLNLSTGSIWNEAVTGLVALAMAIWDGQAVTRLNASHQPTR